MHAAHVSGAAHLGALINPIHPRSQPGLRGLALPLHCCLALRGPLVLGVLGSGLRRVLPLLLLLLLTQRALLTQHVLRPP